MTTALVTGAGGYVGGRLCRELAAHDVKVRALVHEHRDWLDPAEQIVGDLFLEPDLARDAAVGADVVFHLAGANEVKAELDPDAALAETIVAARRVAACTTARTVYLSTVHVYGAALQPGAQVTEDTPLQPRHPYAIARLAGEHLFASLAAEPVLIRLTNAVGAPVEPRVDRWSLVANELCREAATVGTMTLRSDGSQWRDFVALSDVVTVLAELARPGRLRPGTYNLGYGRCHTVRTLAELVAEAFVALGRPRPTLVAPAPAAESVAPYQIRVDRLRASIPCPATSLAEAIGETARFCIAHAADLR
ncbi:MAG: NAD-dependent epimerase/dehydratase family protein [Acidimicrobiales bacterium]